MVKKYGEGGKTSIQADIIVLGCTLPGIVAAHKLKRKFGDSMDIVVLDLPGPSSMKSSRCNVAFMEHREEELETQKYVRFDFSARELLDNVARYYLLQYAKEFKVPLPDSIIYPHLEIKDPYEVPTQSQSKEKPTTTKTAETTETAQTAETTQTAEAVQTAETLETAETPKTPKTAETPETAETSKISQTTKNVETTETPKSAETAETPKTAETPETAEAPTPPEPEEKIPLQKLFQYPNGSTVQFLNNVHDFEYLSFLEKFELNQYQTFLDKCMMDLFQTNKTNLEEERKTLLYYDRTTMEKNICETLLFSTSREIMRIIVRLVCGASANSVSLLFYLHQCYRTSSAKNHLGGLNTRFREKLLGQCRKRLSNKLHQSIADITLIAKSIKEIRTYSEQVILETIKGDTTYICNLLAMALRPEQLNNIQVEDRLLSEEHSQIAKNIKPGYAKKFTIKYEDNFWCKQGYSGDIFSMRGPIIWAMERPKLSTTGSLEKYSGLVGYLMVTDDDKDDNEDHEGNKEAVVSQLVNLFGEAAAYPVSYTERRIKDIYVPRCGDYVALHKLTREGSPKFMEWGALDIFADGDVAAALEAGHSAYLHLLACLRPQAQTYDDIIVSDYPMFLSESPVSMWMSQINVKSSIKFTLYTAVLCIGVTVLRSFMRN